MSIYCQGSCNFRTRRRAGCMMGCRMHAVVRVAGGLLDLGYIVTISIYYARGTEYRVVVGHSHSMGHQLPLERTPWTPTGKRFFYDCISLGCFLVACFDMVMLMVGDDLHILGRLAPWKSTSSCKYDTGLMFSIRALFKPSCALFPSNMNTIVRAFDCS
jgi:hypothetical protein